LSTQTITRLAEFVRKQFNIDSGAKVTLTALNTVSSTCFRRLDLQVEGSGGNRSIRIFLSPDQRFLAPQLFDTEREGELRRDIFKAPDAPSRGRPDALVEITVFEDFQCPFCKQQTEIVDRLLSEGASIRLIFRYLPLQVHDWARPAAEMAACARKQSEDAFWASHDFLFKNQSSLTADNPGSLFRAAIATRTDIDISAWDFCTRDRQGRRDVDRDLEFARDHNINATPTLFIGGIRFDRVVSAGELRDIIQKTANDLKN